MALNVPSGNKKNLSFGPGILLITTDILATPNIDIGYVQGAQFQVQKQKLEVKQGSPKSLVASFGLEEDVSLNVVGLEWNLANLNYVLAGGAVHTSSNTFGFGGNVEFDEVALLYRHKTPSQGTVENRLWRCQGEGNLSVNFNDNLQEFPFNFKALEADKQWGGGTLPETERRGQILYVRGA